MKEIRKYSMYFVPTDQTSRQQTLQDKFKTITCDFESMDVKYDVEFCQIEVSSPGVLKGQSLTQQVGITCVRGTHSGCY